VAEPTPAAGGVIQVFEVLVFQPQPAPVVNCTATVPPLEDNDAEFGLSEYTQPAAACDTESTLPATVT
jgi:hypothetical protein